MWEPAEVGAVDLATSGRRPTAQTTDSEGRRGRRRREPEAMDEQSVEVRGAAEGGGCRRGAFSIPGAMLSPAFPVGGSLCGRREGGWP